MQKLKYKAFRMQKSVSIDFTLNLILHQQNKKHENNNSNNSINDNTKCLQ